MRHHLTTILSLLLILCATDALAGESLLRVSDIRVSRNADKLDILLDIDPRRVNPGRDREVIFTPVVVSSTGNDSVVLPAIRIAGRNRYYSHLRNNNMPEGTRLFSADSRETIQYRHSTPFLPWMERSTIEMRQSTGNCCNPILPDTEADRPLAKLDFTVPQYPAALEFVALTGDETIERSAEGSAFIDFVVNKTDIRPTYRNNTKELAKIIATINVVKNDPDATITRVTIKGFASPEGSYSNNVRLAMGRTQALKEYVREYYHFPHEIMSTDYEPEDWEGLIKRLQKINIPHREEILQIAKSDMEPDPRNAEIQKRYPKEYKFILDSIYPALRHSDYTVKYRIRTYVDIEELKRVYAGNPANLRPVDFERIASTMTPGSPEWDEVYLKAAELYPNDTDAALNGANILMKQGKLTEAARLLNNAGERPEAFYSRATLAALNGDLQRAHTLFGQAADAGFSAARVQQENIDSMMKRNYVEYLISPE